MQPFCQIFDTWGSSLRPDKKEKGKEKKRRRSPDCYRCYISTVSRLMSKITIWRTPEERELSPYSIMPSGWVLGKLSQRGIYLSHYQRKT